MSQVDRSSVRSDASKRSRSNCMAPYVLAGAVLLVMVAGRGGATGQSVAPVVPDAQVEADVLKALSEAPELAKESITTQTVYGTVTLSGSVRDEARRLKAETLAAHVIEVRKVIDELELAGTTSERSGRASTPVGREVSRATEGSRDGSTPMLQSDGTYAPAGRASGDDQTTSAGTLAEGPSQRATPNEDPERQAQPPSNDRAGWPMPAYPSGADGRPWRRPMRAQDCSNESVTSCPPLGYPRNFPPSAGGAATYADPRASAEQAGGVNVLVPRASMIRVRVNRNLSSDHSQPGMVFDGVVVNDVVADGYVAIPRGATVQGRVVDAKTSGVLKGRGDISIELTHVVLGGRVYPVRTDLWAHHGGDKTLETVNKTAGLGAVGAVFGALAGGGVGAAIGGGIGAAVGLGSSAASGNGQVVIPSESMITFHLVQEVALNTVSAQEMQRLASGVAPGADARSLQGRAYFYPRVYLGPGYNPGYYPGYGPGYYSRYYPGPYRPYGYPVY